MNSATKYAADLGWKHDDYWDDYYRNKHNDDGLMAMRYAMEKELKLKALYRKAESIAAEAIAQAMTSPGGSVVIANPGTNNPANLQYQVVAGSTAATNAYTQWYNIILQQPAYVNQNATAYAYDSLPTLEMLSIGSDGRIELPKGRQIKMPLGDGSTLYVDKDGNFRVDDKNAKVVYKANRVREFNPYINASDLLVKFIDYVRTLGIKKDDVMTLEVGLFINWLIVEAAERDSDPIPPDVVPVPQHKLLKGRVLPRCILPTCHRFIPRIYAANQFPFCNPLHAEAYIKRLKAA